MVSELEAPIVAAVNGKHMDATVVTTAAVLARHCRRPLVLLHVIEVGHERPVDASEERAILRAERTIAEAERMIPEGRIRMRTEIKQARRASTAIIGTALDEGAETIVVGAHRFLGEHECDLGFTATHVLRRATIPVIVCYDPIR